MNRRKALELLGVVSGCTIFSKNYAINTADPDSEEVRIRYFNSLIQAKKNTSVREGDIIHVMGYYIPGDGGEANYYLIKNKGEINVKNEHVVPLKNGCVGILLGVTRVNYKMFGAIGDSKNDDGEQIKMAHDYANKHQLPVENLSGKYWIGKTRNIEIKTLVQWGQSEFHINEVYNTSEPVFRILSYDLPRNILVDELTKTKIIEGVKPGKQEIPELKKYKNSLILIKDSNDRIGIRSGTVYAGRQSRGKEEIFYIEENGKIIGDIAWSFSNYTELVAYPAESNYLTIEGGSFYLSGNNPGKAQKKYFRNGFVISRSRTIIKNQWVGLENGVEDISLNPRNGFYSLNTVFDVNLENIRLLPWEKDRPGDGHDVLSGTYGIGGYRMLNTTFKNITAEGTSLHWGVFGTNLNKNFRIENCHLNRIDVHFHCWNLTIKDSHIGYKGITITGGGELIIENSTCEDNRFVSFRKDYGGKWDGNIIINNCSLRPNTSSESAILNFIASNFDYGYPIGLAKSISVENFVVDYKNIPDCSQNCWLITSSSFSKSQKGERSFFPDYIHFQHIYSEGRTKGLRLMKIADPSGYLLPYPGSYDGNILESNSSINFDNIQLDQDNGGEGDYHLIFETPLKDSYDNFSLYPKIYITNCTSISIDLGKAIACILIEKSTIHRINSEKDHPIQGELSFLNCKFLPIIGKDRIKPFNLSTELGTSFINCVFHLPRVNQKTEPEALPELIDFFKINKFVCYNHLNSRLGRDILNYCKSNSIDLKPDFISMLKSHHELEDKNIK